MRCLNCHKEIPDTAKVCQYCEAIVEPEPPPEAMRAMREFISQMPPGMVDALREEFERSGTAEEFTNRIMVGECPKCGSEQTGDCENDPEIDNILVGRCYACGQLWCTECGELLDQRSPACACWDEEPE